MTAESFRSLADVPADVSAVADRGGTRWHRGPDRLDWWWPPWDEYAGDPQTPDDVDPFGPFTIIERADPHPDCPGEFHGADGGACVVCGWDSHPIPVPDAGEG